MFSSFFSAKIQNMCDKLDQTPLQPCHPDPPFTGTPLSCFHPVSEMEVSNTLKSMSFKSCELGPIPASLFSDCLPYLLPAIMDIINTSLRTGSFPTAFKTPIVCPLLKKNNLTQMTWKTIALSLTFHSFPSFLRKLSFSSSTTTCQRDSNNNLLHPFQYAYSFNHSTETVLLHTVNDSLLASNSWKVSLLTLPDLSVAFNTTDHTILLTCLEYTFGIHSTAHVWLKSYLYSWFQNMSVNNMQSEPVKLSCGVPQDSVLGPLLLTLYTTPLASIITCHNLNHHFYADWHSTT